MGHSAQNSSAMQGLLVLVSLAVTSAQVLPYYGGLGYAGYAGYTGLGLPYAYAHNILKPVVKEIEVPVETLKFEAKATGCTNSFGNPVPCLAEGEARKKREADDEAAAEEAAPAVLPLGLGYAGLGYTGLGYAGLGYSVALPAPTVTEVEVPQYKLVPKEKVVELLPACQNAWGFGVPCA